MRTNAWFDKTRTAFWTPQAPAGCQTATAGWHHSADTTAPIRIRRRGFFYARGWMRTTAWFDKTRTVFWTPQAPAGCQTATAGWHHSADTTVPIRFAGGAFFMPEAG